MEERVKIQRACRICQGEGMMTDPHCQLCGQRISPQDVWWESDEPLMPCGHMAEPHLIEKRICPECGGNGRLQEWITSDELRTMERAQKARRIFVLGMIALLLVLVGTAVLKEPSYLCGAWWYGGILLISQLVG